MESSEPGRREITLPHCPDSNKDPPTQKGTCPVRPITDVRSVVSDTGHRATCSAGVGAILMATAAPDSCLAGLGVSAAVALNKWIIY